METKQKFTKIKSGLGLNHYEKQLYKQHRKDALNYLKEEGYTLEERRILMAEYDRKIDLKNIIQVHTHFIPYFWEQLCMGNFQFLVNNSTCKIPKS